MFQLTKKEVELMVSHFAIPSIKYLGGFLPYVFTEQGVANLSSVLTNERAIVINIQIMRAFVAMRKFIFANAQIFQRLDQVERKQLAHKMETDERFDRIFKVIEEKEIKPKQGIFFEGQIFDAYQFVSDLIRTARKSIILMDNYIDDTVLLQFSKRRVNVNVSVFTKTISKRLSLDIEKYNKQYPPIEVRQFSDSHDRFLIIDNKTIYHFGASLKDLGKKWFAFSKIETGAIEMLARLKRIQ